MRVKVERCWGGGDRYSFRLTLPNGKREHVSGGEWTRALATEARNILERLHGATRKNIRFIHR